MPVQTVRPEHSEKALFHLCDDVHKRTSGKGLDLLVAILPDNNGPLYGMILDLLFCWTYVSCL